MVQTRDPTTGQLFYDWVAYVALPNNSYGVVSVGELVGTDTEASTEYSFPNGLNGVTITNNCTLLGNLTEADNIFVYAAFNNHLMNDAAVAGLRYLIGPNSSMAFSFFDTPKPTKMTLRIDATQCTAFYAAAEV